MNSLDIPIYEALDKYLVEHEVFIEWDNLEGCYIVFSGDGMDVSKFHEIEDAMKWALEAARLDWTEGDAE